MRVMRRLYTLKIASSCKDRRALKSRGLDELWSTANINTEVNDAELYAINVKF